VIVADPQPLKREVALKVGATGAFARRRLYRRLLSNEPTDDAYLTWSVDSYLESHRFKSHLRPARPSNT
jgi:hypothetical protein